MIVGKGDIATVLPDRNDLLFFASGVSNSLEVNKEEFARERNLLMQQDHAIHIVYFSTLSVFYKDSPYVQHKLLMERLAKDFFSKSTIIRIGNITWGNNPYTLINFIRNKIKNEEPFEMQDVYRYIVEKEEFLYWIDLIPEFSCEMNITGKRLKIRDIVDRYCRI